MAVANETIISKMQQELKSAKDHAKNKNDMLKHVEHVKLLCELLLGEEQSASIQTDEITPTEKKAMMGMTDTEIVRPKPMKKTVIDHDGANGDSIFDF